MITYITLYHVSFLADSRTSTYLVHTCLQRFTCLLFECCFLRSCSSVYLHTQHVFSYWIFFRQRWLVVSSDRDRLIFSIWTDQERTILNASTSRTRSTSRTTTSLTKNRENGEETDAPGGKARYSLRDFHVYVSEISAMMLPSFRLRCFRDFGDYAYDISTTMLPRFQRRCFQDFGDEVSQDFGDYAFEIFDMDASEISMLTLPRVRR